MRLSSNGREQAEIDIHRLEASRATFVGAEMATGNVAKECTERRGRKRRHEFLPEPFSSGKASGDQSNCGRLDVTFDACELPGEAQTRIGLEAKRGVEQLRAVEEGIAM